MKRSRFSVPSSGPFPLRMYTLLINWSLHRNNCVFSKQASGAALQVLDPLCQFFLVGAGERAHKFALAVKVKSRNGSNIAFACGFLVGIHLHVIF